METVMKMDGVEYKSVIRNGSENAGAVSKWYERIDIKIDIKEDWI